MKNIIAFTDFSDASENAIRYAIHLGRKIKANVLIAELDLSYTKSIAMAFAGARHDENASVNNNFRLVQFCDRLEKELLEHTIFENFQPAICCHAYKSSVEDTINLLHESLDIAYVVIAGCTYYSQYHLMLTDFYPGMLDKLQIPLIILPNDARIRYPEKYAFIGDITHNYVRYLNELGSLAAYSAATIMLTNINTGRPLDAEQEMAVKSIMKETTSHVDYGRLYFKHIANEVAKSDMEWLFEDNDFEALAMVYQRHDIYNQVLSFKFDKKIIGTVDVPLIIYPSIDGQEI